MTNEKVVLTREQDFWIRGMRRIKDDYAIIDEAQFGRASDEIIALSIPRLAKALYEGYEVERTQEERYEDVREAYRNAIALENYDERHAIELTLDLLGIKIEGVND
ncbi:hypothetical protein [Shouchella clausii]|uniref:hypothetical protein n=1 Tax=Shouchella clausii TaxID=79880 RepID=UPI000BA64001|nr:hypothetical protein [Shouchella clausii]PAD91673.1 hypothetical protein CHH52_13710 [Shouchella clausii]